MKTLIHKELRENLKVGLIAMAVLALLLASTFKEAMQPALLNLNGTLLFSGTFAALLGWLQTHREHQPDPWAFLVHRPMTRWKIFAAKCVAGLGIYCVAAGLPFLGLLVMAQIPGEVAADFQWAMALPVAVCFLGGIACYFAGMLTGMRQARWYASRGLGLGAALVVCASANLPQFWQALSGILLGGAFLALAAWGSFATGGYYRGQTAAGKLGLSLTMAAGSLVAILCVTILFMNLVRGLSSGAGNDPRVCHYAMTKQGVIWKVCQGGNQPREVTSLDGQPVTDPGTGRRIGLDELAKWVCPGVSATFQDVGFFRGDWDQDRLGTRVLRPYWGNSRFFGREWQNGDVRWYYSYRYRRILGYDLKTRHFVGSIGPRGFVEKAFTGEDHFDPPFDFEQRIITSANVAYLLDFEKRTASNFFTLPQGERVGASADFSFNSYGWDYTVLATERSVYLLTFDGKLTWKSAFQPGPPDYRLIAVFFLEAPGQFSLWLSPNLKSHLPTHAVWLTSGGVVSKTEDLPAHPFPPVVLDWEERVSVSVLPPVVLAVFAEWAPALAQWPIWSLSLAIAAVSAAAGWWMGGRYKTPLDARAGWGIFHLLFGLAGLLAFLSVQEWPARQKCPKCAKLRSVENEQCEYCGAGFAPPERNGTEILEV